MPTSSPVPMAFGFRDKLRPWQLPSSRSTKAGRAWDGMPRPKKNYRRCCTARGPSQATCAHGYSRTGRHSAGAARMAKKQDSGDDSVRVSTLRHASERARKKADNRPAAHHSQQVNGCGQKRPGRGDALGEIAVVERSILLSGVNRSRLHYEHAQEPVNKLQPLN